MEYFEKVESELGLKLEELLKLNLSHTELLNEVKRFGYKVHDVLKLATRKELSDNYSEYSNVYITTEDCEIGMKYYKFYYDFEDLAILPRSEDDVCEGIIIKRNLQSNDLYLMDYRVMDKSDEFLYNRLPVRWVFDAVVPIRYSYATAVSRCDCVVKGFNESELEEIMVGISEEEKRQTVEYNNKVSVREFLTEEMLLLIPEEYRESLRVFRDIKDWHGKVSLNGTIKGYRFVSGDYVVDLTIGLAKFLISGQSVGMAEVRELEPEDFKDVKKLTKRDFEKETPEFLEFIEKTINRGMNIMGSSKITELSNKILNGEIKFKNKVLQHKMGQFAWSRFGCNGWFKF